MKATFEQLGEDIQSSFLYRRFHLPRFDAPFHYHPELELTLIEQSYGRRFIGSRIDDFEAGDLVLLGENVPHCWLNAEEVVEARSIVIQFKWDFAGNLFWQMPEMHAIQQLCQKAQAGVLIKGKTRDIVMEKMQMEELSVFQKLLRLLEILQTIALSTETTLIDTEFSSLDFSNSDNERFQKIYAYLIENYRNDIELNTIAAIAHLTPTAFCRYFKKMTRKTLLEVVTEFRIKHACQLLRSTTKPVNEICFESGFGNVSHFHKEFKRLLGFSPGKYRGVY